MRWLIAAAVGAIAAAGLYLLTPRISAADPALPRPAAVPDVRVRYPAGRWPMLTLPDGQQRAVRSVLNVPRRMRYGDFVWDDTGVPAGAVWVRIDLTTQMLSAFRDGHEIGSAVVLYGTDHKPTPAGVFHVLERAEQHRSTLYDAEMPYMLRLTADGVAIHASNVRAGSATHGCIGVPIGFARRLFAEIRRGDLVAIERPPVAARLITGQTTPG